jgi:hypothetical protein
MSDPILAAIADHRRLWNELCASIRDFENVNELEPQTDFFERQLAALVAERDRLEKAERRALNALSRRITPTTPAGAGALVAYVREDMKDGEAAWQHDALGNAARALATMTVES